MDVEKLRKVNVLASTLKQQGLAASSEDAACLANTMVPGKCEEDLDKIFAQADHSVAFDNKPEEQKAEKDKGTFTEEQVKNILQCFSDQFCAEIDKLAAKQAQLEEALSRLGSSNGAIASKNEVSEQDIKDVMDEGSSVVLDTDEKVQEEQKAEPEPVAKPRVEAPHKEEKQDSPRSGGYNSDDVSIEKFFYYGQK